MKLYVYISQSDRGELVMRSEIEPGTRYRTLERFYTDDLVCELAAAAVSH